MENDRPPLTDPAREMVELCERLQSDSGAAGEAYLAERFGVRAWSREFHQIVYVISERCSLLQAVIGGLEIDDDYRAEIVRHVGTVRQAFSADGMKNGWASYGNRRIGEVQTGPLKVVSSLVRARVAYRRLSPEEVAEVVALSTDLLTWLEERQLAEQDFVRQALVDGLRQMVFRLERLGWLGWGYALEGLREVVAAYVLLERSGADAVKDPERAAVLQKTGAALRSIYARVTTVRNVAETGDWLLRAYGVGTLAYGAAGPLIAGLLK